MRATWPVCFPCRVQSSLLVPHPGVDAAENDGWKSDQKIKKKTDGNGDQNQGELDRIKHELSVPVIDLRKVFFFHCDPVRHIVVSPAACHA